MVLKGIERDGSSCALAQLATIEAGSPDRNTSIELCERGEHGSDISFTPQVQASSAFTDDLGLDSLDAVEVVMAIEEEFSIVSLTL